MAHILERPIGHVVSPGLGTRPQRTMGTERAAGKRMLGQTGREGPARADQGPGWLSHRGGDGQQLCIPGHSGREATRLKENFVRGLLCKQEHTTQNVFSVICLWASGGFLSLAASRVTVLVDGPEGWSTGPVIWKSIWPTLWPSPPCW